MRVKNGSYSVAVLVNGRPITEYEHDGDTFIEGREGSQYEIEFTNHTSQRVLALMSVDGLSVLDGKRATRDSQGYVVEAFGKVRVPGWRLSAEEVAAFKFGAVKSSYNSQSGGDTANVGVIGVRVFSERPKPPTYNIYHHFNNGWPCYGVNSPTWVNSPTIYGNGLRGVGIAGDTLIGASLNAQNSMTTASASATAKGPISSASVGDTPTAYMASASPTLSATTVQQSLGTEFGQAQSFRTTDATFERGSEAATLLLYYDSARGLTARGITLARPKPAKPQAFADQGCTPPPGWQR